MKYSFGGNLSEQEKVSYNYQVEEGQFVRAVEIVEGGNIVYIESGGILAVAKGKKGGIEDEINGFFN